MCFLLFSINQSTNFPFILAANRDEFYGRETAQLGIWQDKPHILGGRDLQQGGTWMAVSQSGRFAAITNFRETKKSRTPFRSRGLIITDFLDSDITTEEFQQSIERQSNQYDGFNLVFGELGNRLIYYSNRGGEKSITLKSGSYVLSNHRLNTPWPKAIRGKSSFEKIICLNNQKMESSLLELLSDDKKADKTQLPNTGIDKNFEYLLSSIYIESENYGTRCSSILMLDDKNNLRFTELTHKPNDTLTTNPATLNLQL